MVNWICMVQSMKSVTKMSALKSWLVCLVFLMDYTNSVTSENSENNNSTQLNSTYWQSVANCVKKQSKMLTYCVFKQSLHHLDEAISNNETWQLNGYMSLKKNEDWKPIVLEARAMRSPYGQIVSRLGDLMMSRSLQFTLPPNDDGDQREGRHYGGNSGSSAYMGMSFVKAIQASGIQSLRFFLSGRKKKHKGGMKFSGIALVAMFAQFFLGKIAFLAGASFLLSKLALLFSIFVSDVQFTSHPVVHSIIIPVSSPFHRTHWRNRQVAHPVVNTLCTNVIQAIVHPGNEALSLKCLRSGSQIELFINKIYSEVHTIIILL